MVIAHRGASGHLPENTLPAFALAHAVGAHAVELDVVMTRDRVPVAFHDLTLEGVTDVRVRHPDRARADGHWYVMDLLFEELRELELRSSVAREGPPEDPIVRIPSLDEVVRLLGARNAASGREVALFCELKAAAWHRTHGIALEEPLAELARVGGGNAPFPPIRFVAEETECLRRLRFELGSGVPLVQIIDEGPAFDAMTTPQGLDRIAIYADAIAPEKRRVEDRFGRAVAQNALVRSAQARGLTVYPFTFGMDGPIACWARFEAELKRFFTDHGVDGVFTDFPERALAVLGSA